MRVLSSGYDAAEYGWDGHAPQLSGGQAVRRLCDGKC